MAQSLIIVESPAKARTISKFLGDDFVVESSIGHIRDLPSKVSDLPEAVRKRGWARIGVDVDNGFKPLYVVPPEKKAQVKKLKGLLKDAAALYLATDEDREGEAIAWHLVEVLSPKVPVRRMVFHEITDKAIHEALAHPREIDRRLVDAQEARRILDRLYGYEVSPVLWRKVRPRLSAGRVQSVATRLVVERERQRRAFRSAAYWSLRATLLGKEQAKGNNEVVAELQELGGRRIAIGRHFDASSGQLSEAASKDKVFQLTEALAKTLEEKLVGKSFTVIDIEEKPFTQRPYAPFITSTLQQEAGRKMGFSAQRTMRTAQRLYERGYITYMRTDSTALSQEALNASRRQITELYGSEHLPEKPRHYTKKVKGAQEAHEAIRPAGEAFRLPDSLRNELDADEMRLYDLIWKRTIACQMKDATGRRTQVRFRVPLEQVSDENGESIDAGIFSASGRVLTFPGFMRVYVEGSDDPDVELETRNAFCRR